MLHLHETKTLRETVAPGGITSEGLSLDEAHLWHLAAAVGLCTAQGPIEVVSVFFVMEREAEPWLEMAGRLGLEVRAIRDNQEVVLVEAPRRVLLPRLRAEDWPDAAGRLCRRLLPEANGSGPWVSFGFDAPETFTTLGVPERGELPPPLPVVERQAIENLAGRSPQRSEVAPGIVGLADEYASELVLVPAVLRSLRAELGAQILALAVPCHGLLYATNVTGHGVPILTRIAEGMFGNSSAEARLSPLVFVTMDDAVAGLVTTAPPDAPKRGFFAKLFG